MGNVENEPAGTTATLAPATPEGGKHRRPRNPRGEGGRLADEIVTAALDLIERDGGEEAVTLRAVAREVGIAAPSIYAHFDGREAILLAVVQRVFGQLAEFSRAAIDAAPDPVAKLLAGTEAYVTFGLEHPARYSVLFGSERGRDMCKEGNLEIGRDGRPRLDYGGEAFDLLVAGIEACVDAGRSTSTDVVGDAVAVWVGLHGTVSLWSALWAFPWPEREQFVANLVLSLAKVTAP